MAIRGVVEYPINASEDLSASAKAVEHGIKLVYREIATNSQSISMGAISAADVEYYVAEFLKNGWTLQSTHFAGVKMLADGGGNVLSLLFVLVK